MAYVLLFIFGFVLGLFAPGSRWSILRRLASIDFGVEALLHRGEQFMTTVTDINTKLDRITAATTGIAGDLRTIKQELADAATPDQLAAIGDRLEDAAATLESLDAQTANAATDQPQS